MTIRVALNHRTTYQYDRYVAMGPQVIRLRPAPHCRTPISSYSLTVEPGGHFLNWQQDPHGNYLARVVFPQKVDHLDVNVDLIAEMTVINPFNFFLEPTAEFFPFCYDDALKKDLLPFLEHNEASPLLLDYVRQVDLRPRRTIDFLVDLNRNLQQRIGYVIRLEPGVQTCEETLRGRSGSCRDSGWLLVQILRHLGLAARFTSGYLIQLTADVKSLDGPSGPERDFTDLHAWAEVFLPGAGWIGLDPTSGLFAGEGHIPVACTPTPQTAAPISGALEPAECQFQFSMEVTRVHEDPRVTKPYSEEQWERIVALGHDVDRRLDQADVRLTMGGEPTFVSVDDMESEQWKTAALGPQKKELAGQFLSRLRRRFAPGGMFHFGQGKWYPGESLPRWAMQFIWRKDGEPIWYDEGLSAIEGKDHGYSVDDADRFARTLARRLGVNSDHVLFGYEDAMYYMWKERRLPANVNVFENRLENEEERARIARVFEHGLQRPVGCVLPIRYRWWDSQPAWQSGMWQVRSDEMFLLPGDSAMGYRLPLQSLTWIAAKETDVLDFSPVDPCDDFAELPRYEALREHLLARIGQGSGPSRWSLRHLALRHQHALARTAHTPEPDMGMSDYTIPENGNGHPHKFINEQAFSNGKSETRHSESQWHDVVRTALCVEPREGRLHIFLPPIEMLEPYLELVAAIEMTARSLDMPIVLEGYPPPYDPRISHLKVTPDPGVIEVNVHPAKNWDELMEITLGVYEEAHATRLGTEKFDLDGTHTGTGGGNHVVLGGATVADSPFLRRPDLLRSLVGFWHNHPSLSYLFSGRFIGPTSQAPRIDEGRADALYELKIAFEQIPDQGECPAWLVDRVFRHLLVDGTGNTHRAEFCIDKLFAPESATGRLGLVEFRAFEMPPHARMSLTQQLLLRSLIARFWEEPYRSELVHWGTTLHDRFMLPFFVWQDFEDVIQDLRSARFPLEPAWFLPHFEFRFPFIGQICHAGVKLELRTAIEPWYVLGEEPAGGFTARYVDSSLERLQVLTTGLVDRRYIVTCNGRRVPLHPTGTEGEYVAGVRYRAWQPPSCLHPTLPVDHPLVFDLYDRWSQRSLGGCQYHVQHPGGLNPAAFPINAYEAESRRGTRFIPWGHSAGTLREAAAEPNDRFPLTLDLRRHRGGEKR